MPGRPSEAADRADRILDAAAELTVRLGSRKVTIDDIAQRADIGKGTVYLHWRTKQQLFEALFVREAVIYIETLLDELRRDPSVVLPHRMISTLFLVVSRRPVLRALLTGSLPLLQGRMADSAMRGNELLATARFHEVMLRYGLFRDDVEHLRYGLTAMQAGFYLLDTVAPVPDEPGLEAKAEALAHIVRHAYEPAVPPGPQVIAAAAAEIIALYSTLIPPYRELLYGVHPTRQD
ncbi:TetR/AcrR family transcriptional regulator [Nonomuraea sp. NEAU-A123]|uniref:TetR/AcrR family transcriptional regulator n=1 Tax=Nonomuraea sp. NEAU-A123 TaxID=2839649 RepID=UPI001BE3CFB2|nr:TetR/AcrR family transcriptional regulator [Nonomuraea sp. NEAU-A123]MBT2230892.1 TetR/AcrR family transcriptional regulator [Nonomuraea sp. NEAU-A123]